MIKPDNPCYIKLANTWIILNSGGGPTPDKPQVILETPSDRNRINSFLNLRVADIWACYKQWADKGAFVSYGTIKQSRLGMALLHCATLTVISSRSANILKSPSTGSTTTVNLVCQSERTLPAYRALPMNRFTSD